MKKYIIESGMNVYFTDHRNCKKFMRDHGVDYCVVFTDTKHPKFVIKAVRGCDGFVGYSDYKSPLLEEHDIPRLVKIRERFYNLNCEV